jgi:hypothetical protein
MQIAPFLYALLLVCLASSTRARCSVQRCFADPLQTIAKSGSNAGVFVFDIERYLEMNISVANARSIS